MRYLKLLILTGFIFSLTTCKQSGEENFQVPELHELNDGTRIAWDISSLTKVAPISPATSGYYGYARMIQLHDERLACVYETSAGNIELVMSSTLGNTWGGAQIIFQENNATNMSAPEIIELSDRSVLVACNPRPREPYTENRKFGIKVRRSSDGCQTWNAEQTIYEAQSTFENGCWEPSMVQLPNNQIQLFFANEGNYTSSNEQNISMLESYNAGETWSVNPKVVGFRKGKRDGMPVPLLLEDEGELLIAVEDNKIGEFKPSIFHEKISENWVGGTILADDARRDYHPLHNQLSENTYAGAPYLARLNSGEVLLSYQSNWNRDLPWDKSAMVVEIGDKFGTAFHNRTIPFPVSLSKHGLWNSITVIGNNIPVAITSTNAYSTNSTEVWMIKGNVIQEVSLKYGSAKIDGKETDECWQQDWSYFIGHKSNNQLKAALCSDSENLYLAAKIYSPAGDLDTTESSMDGFVFYLDVERKGYVAPHKGIFAFHISVNGKLEVKEGAFGEWDKAEGTTNLQIAKQANPENCTVECSIPWEMFMDKCLQSKALGVGFSLNKKIGNGSMLTEHSVSIDPGKPWTWYPITK